MTDREAKRVLADIAQDPDIKLPSRLADVLEVLICRASIETDMCVQISELDALATHSVTFYSHHCKAWKVLRSNIRREIRNTEGFGAVLRGNTLSSKMMSKYVRLAGGNTYLQQTFGALVSKTLSATWLWDAQIHRDTQSPEESAKSTLARDTRA